MSSIQPRSPVQQVLRDRPYLRWELVPIAAVLCVLDYHADAREVIVDSLARGITLDALASTGWVKTEDLEQVREASRRWYASRSGFAEWVQEQGGIAWEEGRDA